MENSGLTGTFRALSSVAMLRNFKATTLCPALRVEAAALVASTARTIPFQFVDSKNRGTGGKGFRECGHDVV